MNEKDDCLRGAQESSEENGSESELHVCGLKLLEELENVRDVD